jgi:hypothetical protein
MIYLINKSEKNKLGMFTSGFLLPHSWTSFLLLDWAPHKQQNFSISNRVMFWPPSDFYLYRTWLQNWGAFHWILWKNAIHHVPSHLRGLLQTMVQMVLQTIITKIKLRNI